STATAPSTVPRHDALPISFQQPSRSAKVSNPKSVSLPVAWVNRDRRSRHPDVPQPDFEIPDLTQPSLLPSRRLGQTRNFKIRLRSEEHTCELQSRGQLECR